MAFIQVLTIHPLYHAQIHSSIILLYPSSPIPGIVSTGLIFLFTYMCTQYLHHIHPPIPISHFLPSPTGINPHPPPGRTCSDFLFFDFVKEKKEKE
jgi:hypothetical protein